MARPPVAAGAAVAAGGALGALLRVSLAEAYATPAGTFPTVTFVENALGALVLGALLALLRGRARGGGGLYYFACTGVLGSFTTFSAFSVEIVELSSKAGPALALAYPAASVAVGIAAAALGVMAGGRLAGPERGAEARPTGGRRASRGGRS